MKFSLKPLRKNGLSLAELMVVVLVLLPALLATVLVFIRCLELIELSKNTSLALWEVKNKINAVETTGFSQVAATFHQSTFQSANLTGRGVCYVESLQADLLRVTVSFSWREKGGRIIGEDKDFDGVIDAGEDVNGNGFLDSPVKLVTLIYDM